MGINFKKIGEESAASFDALPMNRYNLKVEDAEMKTASTGSEMIAVTFVVAEGDYKNRKAWNNFSLVPKAMVFLHQFLKAAGSKLIENDDVNPEDLVKEMIGLEVNAYTEPGQTPSGNPKNTLTQWKPVVKSDSDLFS